MARPAFILIAVAIVVSFASVGWCNPASVNESMNTPIPAFACQGTLRQVILKIADATKVIVEVDWNALAASGAKFDAAIKLSASRATAGQLLDSALAQTADAASPLTWQIKDQVVRVTTQRRVLSAGGDGAYVRIAAQPAAKPAIQRQPAPSRPDNVPNLSTRPAGGDAGARELNFENTPLGDVLEFCRRTAGVNMHVNWNALQAVSIDKSTPVSIRATDITVAKTLNLVFENLNAGKDKMGSVYWVIDGGTILISSGSALDIEMRTKTFDVADLLMIVPNFKGPTINLTANNAQGNTANSGNTNSGIFGTDTSSNNSGNSSTEEDQDTAELRKQVQDTLIAAIQEAIGMDMWAPQGKGSIRLLGKQLIITQSLLGWKLMEKSSGR